MKRFAIFTMLIITTLCCVFAFSACDEDVATLAMDKRYIYKEKYNDKQAYYVFHSNGTGEYTYYYAYEGTSATWHHHYTIHFKYTYVDSDKSAVVCFYNSLERLDDDDGKETPSTEWSELVTVSKNVLATVGTYGYTFWINEDYLKTIPNYGS